MMLFAVIPLIYHDYYKSKVSQYKKTEYYITLITCTHSEYIYINSR